MKLYDFISGPCPNRSVGPEYAVASGGWENLIRVRFLAQGPLKTLTFGSCWVIDEAILPTGM